MEFVSEEEVVGTEQNYLLLRNISPLMKTHFGQKVSKRSLSMYAAAMKLQRLTSGITAAIFVLALPLFILPGGEVTAKPKSKARIAKAKAKAEAKAAKAKAKAEEKAAKAEEKAAEEQAAAEAKAAEEDFDRKEAEEKARIEAEESYDFVEKDGRDENPNAPAPIYTKKEEPTAKKTKKTFTGYPTREIDRPVNLPGGMSEIHFELPLRVDPFSVGASLRGDYGITSKIQIGLHYGMGAMSEDGFSVGKAVALDAQYLITDGIAARISIPMYLDPFALGLVLGAPMKFKFFDRFSLSFGEDLVSIKLHEFFPSVDNAAQNDIYIADLEDRTITPRWQGKLAVRATYQVNPKFALDTELGTQFDNTINAATTLLNVGAIYVLKNQLDLGARVGSNNLSAFVDSLSLTAFLNYRI